MVKKNKVVGRGLLDTVFSWSISDVLNEDLYKDRVKKIPDAFSSKSTYMRSFILPLLEETRADLQSSMSALSQAPICQVLVVKRAKNFQLPSDLFYSIELKRQGGGTYQPVVGDLIAVTDVIPKCFDDLNTPFVIAFVHQVCPLGTHLTVLSSSSILKADEKKKETAFAVYLTNMTTNIRIWRSLNNELEGGSLKIIDKVLQANSSDSACCSKCPGMENSSAAYSEVTAKIYSSDLNDSQKDGILSCIRASQCCHQNTIKLIWGPPGTGKTATVGLMFWSLLKLKCRTLTCTPTNVAVVEVAKRLLKEATNKESSHCGNYGLGNILVFGNGERMKINDHDDLHGVFLDYRVDVLAESLDGWEHCLASMICLLQDPQGQYLQYLKNSASEEEAEIERRINYHEPKNGTSRKLKRKEKENGKKELSGCQNEDRNADGLSLIKNNEQEPEKNDKCFSFEEFFNKRFNRLNEQLNSCILNLSAHLPTSFISLEDVNNMFRALDLLRSVKTSSDKFSRENAGLKQILYDSNDKKNRVGSFLKLRKDKSECLGLLKLLPQRFSVPSSRKKLYKFCLANASLIFCTVSSSAKMHTKKMPPIEILVIDEAAQLKECESTIPLQLSGLRHAILVGDERQLPAMVRSKISDKAEFGRSLFERLVNLGHRKHLFNVQYRMHTSISLFPNKEFYDGKILNAQNVQEKSYKRKFIEGKMYGSYSFINVTYGREEYDDNHSLRNMVEASLVLEIVRNLHKEYVKTKKDVRVGVISPYNAQVYAIKDKINEYSKDSEIGFKVNVSSVDGFQGGEEDIIIISTVRCNGNGSIGFLSDQRRANVALTRARHCLWILGNGETLLNSNSVWKKLILDAKARGCFYNADEDKTMARALFCTLTELNEPPPMFRIPSARWQVRFSDEFWRSMGRVGSWETCSKVYSILEKLSSGWRQSQKKKKNDDDDGVCSELLEKYEVNELLSLVWTVDILQQHSHHIQVMMVWDISPKSDIPKIAKRLHTFYRNYSTVKIEQCKYKCVDGNLVVPMKWPVDSTNSFQFEAVDLLKPFALLRIGDKSEKPAESKRWRKKER